MNNGALCRALMAADTEAEVISLLTEQGFWDDPACWRYIGDIDSNWSTIGNQQSDSIAALAEKFINSIDARLLNACREANIDPKGPDAPETMREAVARFFEQAPNPKADHVGRVANWTDPEIRTQAWLLTLAVTGGAGGRKPCLSIADVGEGQTPDGVPDTFMSLDKRNKVDIPFVQGKYNMGGTGALFSCGEHKIQLLVTRRNPLLTSGDERDGEWGFTVTRWESIGGRNPVFTYLAPLGAEAAVRRGKILSFAAHTMPLLPEASKEARSAYYREVSFGSLVKLFEYDFPRTSDIIRTRGGLRQRIETQLPELALPIGVFECRPGKKGADERSFFTPARGTATRLEQEKNSDQLEFPAEVGLLNLRGFEVRVSAYAFKRVPGQKKRDGFLADYAQGAGVLYTLNGQTHAKAGNEFFIRDAVGLDYLRNDLLVVVDCSGIDEMTRAQLFMNSRDRARLTPMWRDMEKLVERFLKQNEALQQLALRRREDAIREKTEDENALADLLGRVFQASPDLAKLLLGGTRLSSPFAKPGTGVRRKAKDFKGKHVPSFFHFEKLKADEELKRRAEVGRELKIAFATDVQNSYFIRPSQRGSLSVTLTRGERTTEVNAAMLTLSSGVARWSCDLPDDVRVDDLLIYDFVITDETQERPFRNRLHVEVVPRNDRTGGGGGRRMKRGNEGDGPAEGEAGLSLPQVYPIKHGDPEWDEFDFDEGTALFIRRSPGSDRSTAYDFFYNADNEALLRAQKEKPQDKDVTRERFKCALVMVGLALIQETEHQRKRKTSESEAIDLEMLVQLTTRAVAPVLLPLVEFVAALSVAPAQ